MLKKMMLLAVAAVAAVAFAVPASASAQGTLFHEGTPIPTGEHVTIELHGFAEFELPDIASSFGCQVHSEVTLESGHPSHGTANTFEITTNECEGTGLLAECELAEDRANVPWTVEVTATDFVITKPGGEIEIENAFTGECIATGSLLTFPAITATPDNPEAISDVTLSGAGFDDVTGLPAVARGTLEVTPAGTYGIG